MQRTEGMIDSDTLRCKLQQIQNVSGSEKRDHFALKMAFELVVLSHSTVDGLSVALCCATIAAPVPELRSLKVRKYTRCNYEKTARNPPVITSVNIAMA